MELLEKRGGGQRKEETTHALKICTFHALK
jgi:hypothetical protein